MSEAGFVCIGQVAECFSGYPFESKEFCPPGEGEARVFRGDNLKEGCSEWGAKEKRWKAISPGLEKYQLKQNDVLVGMDGSKVGKNWTRVDKGDLPALLGQRVCRIRAGEFADQDFIFHVFGSYDFKSYVECVKTGTSIPHISNTQIRDFGVFLPPLPEQKKIAEILSGIDFLLKALNDLIAKQVSLKKAMTWDLMSHGAGSKDLKDSEQGKIPSDWEVRSLGSVFTLTSGKSKPKSLLSSIATGTEKIPVYGGNGITGYASEYLLDLPTITIGRVGEYCGAVHLSPNMCWVTDNALYIKDRISDFDLPFMYYFLVFCEISKMRKKGGQPLISQKPILDLVVALPPIEEQRRIALTLNSISKNISILEVRRQRIKGIKDSVSQDLLSGRKRVSI